MPNPDEILPLTGQLKWVLVLRLSTLTILNDLASGLVR
jgi:hypothetical protein